MSRDSLDQMFLNTRNSLYGGLPDGPGEEEAEEDEPDALPHPRGEPDPFVEE